LEIKVPAQNIRLLGFNYNIYNLRNKLSETREQTYWKIFVLFVLYKKELREKILQEI